MQKPAAQPVGPGNESSQAVLAFETMASANEQVNEPVIATPSEDSPTHAPLEAAISTDATNQPTNGINPPIESAIQPASTMQADTQQASRIVTTAAVAGTTEPTLSTDVNEQPATRLTEITAQPAAVTTQPVENQQDALNTLLADLLAPTDDSIALQMVETRVEASAPVTEAPPPPRPPRQRVKWTVESDPAELVQVETHTPEAESATNRSND